MFCSKCGNEIPDGGKFCNKCGSKIQAPEGQGLNAEAGDASPDVPAESASSKPIAEQPVKTNGTEIKPKGKKPLVIGIVAAVAAVAVGFGVYQACFAPYNIDSKTFPDAAVRNAMLLQVDTDHDGKVSREEADETTLLTIIDSNVSDFTGVNKLKNLETLTITYSNGFGELDLASFPSVKRIYASGSSITSVKNAGSSKVEIFDATDTPIQEADFSGCETLKELYLSTDNYNEDTLSSVNLSGCKSLETFSAASRLSLLSVDVSDCENLSNLDLRYSTAVVGLDKTNLEARYYVHSWTESDSTSYSGFTKTTCKRDEQGRLIEAGDEKYTYDDAGRIASIKSGSSRYSSETKYAYDEKGLLKSTNGKDIKAEYDEQGRVVSDSDGNQYSYDDSGHVVKISFDSSAMADNTFTYSDSGLLTQANLATGYFKDGNVYACTFDYDDAGRCTQMVVSYPDNSGQTVFTFAYDDKGNIVSAERTDSSSSNTSTISTANEYDSYGNLSERTVTYSSGTLHITTTYYLTNGRLFVSKDSAPVGDAIFLGNQQFGPMASAGNPYLDSQTYSLDRMIEWNFGKACAVMFAPSDYHHPYYGGLTYDQWKATQA